LESLLRQQNKIQHTLEERKQSSFAQVERKCGNKQTNKQNTSGSKNTSTAKRQKKMQGKSTERKPDKER
jgi:hypothetical protein